MDFCFGFSHLKRRRLQHFLGGSVTAIQPWSRNLPAQSRVFIWGARSLPKQLVHSDAQVVRVEDGFLRSVGLGAAFAPPVSWTFDAQGLHHWGHAPSELECLLQSTDFGAGQRADGERLIEMLRLHKLSKYNVGSTGVWPGQEQLLAFSGKKVLVIGQVADDAALQGIQTPTQTNMQLLAHTRALHPNAFIAYKRHPDVSAGLRVGNDTAAEQYADSVMEGVGLHEALAWVDEVHVLNSLSGFEALIAGKPVVCHAQPFYSGWGLTRDLHPCARRTRRLELSELVFAALALYPHYMHPDRRERLDVFGAIDYLTQLRQQPVSLSSGLVLGRLYGFLRRLSLA